MNLSFLFFFYFFFFFFFFFFSSRRRHTRSLRDWSSDVCSSDLPAAVSSRPSRAEDRPTNDGPSLLRRSEEHTSELQSRRDLVCRLLLEKKNRSRGRRGDGAEGEALEERRRGPGRRRSRLRQPRS